MDNNSGIKIELVLEGEAGPGRGNNRLILVRGEVAVDATAIDSSDFDGRLSEIDFLSGDLQIGLGASVGDEEKVVATLFAGQSVVTGNSVVVAGLSGDWIDFIEFGNLEFQGAELSIEVNSNTGQYVFDQEASLAAQNSWWRRFLYRIPDTNEIYDRKPPPTLYIPSQGVYFWEPEPFFNSTLELEASLDNLEGIRSRLIFEKESLTGSYSPKELVLSIGTEFDVAALGGQASLELTLSIENLTEQAVTAYAYLKRNFPEAFAEIEVHLRSNLLRFASTLNQYANAGIDIDVLTNSLDDALTTTFTESLDPQGVIPGPQNLYEFMYSVEQHAADAEVNGDPVPTLQEYLDDIGSNRFDIQVEGNEATVTDSSGRKLEIKAEEDGQLLTQIFDKNDVSLTGERFLDFHTIQQIQQDINGTLLPLGFDYGNGVVFFDGFDPTTEFNNTGTTSFLYYKYGDLGEVSLYQETIERISPSEIIVRARKVESVTDLDPKGGLDISITPDGVQVVAGYHTSNEAFDPELVSTFNEDRNVTGAGLPIDMREAAIAYVTGETQLFPDGILERFTSNLSDFSTNSEKGTVQQIIRNEQGEVVGISTAYKATETSPQKKVTQYLLDPQNENGPQLQFTYENGQKVADSYQFEVAGIVIDAGYIGSVFGSTLGRQLFGDSQLEQAAGSVIFGTIGENLSELAYQALSSKKIVEEVGNAFDDFLPDLSEAAQGAISSIIASELVEALGLEGVAADFASTVGAEYIGKMVDNILDGTDLTAGLGNVDIQQIGLDFIAGYVGREIGAAVYDVKSKEGAIGAAVGASIGTYSGAKIGLEIGKIWGPIGAAIGAAIGYVLGGVLGDLFGGTPRSGADVIYDPDTNEFIVTNVWRKDGGSKSAAKSLATNAANTLNSILGAIAGEVLNEGTVYGGTYGLRKDKYTYRPEGRNSPRTKFADAQDLLNFGVLKAIEDLEIGGGDFYIKRAVYATTDRLLAGGELTDEALSIILGNISTAADYAFYLENSTFINAQIAAEPDSEFAAAWVTTLQLADEIGINRRHQSDHFGGWQYILDSESSIVDSISGIQEVSALASAVEFVYRDNERIIGVHRADGSLSVINDYILPELKTEIQFTNQAALDAALDDVHSSAVITGTNGVDIINAGDLGNDVFGGDGADQITGGKNADWLIGGDGDDILDAVAGNNNALFGGAGIDTLYGGAGSDWLDGGADSDTILADDGDDVLTGGLGSDDLQGQGGNDTYIFRRGDGQDVIADRDQSFSEQTAFGFGWLSLFGYSVWRNGVYGGEIGGGTDTIEFGDGIDLNHVNIRLDTVSDTLIITLLDDAGLPTGDSLSLADWSNSFRRIEKLRFSNGEEIDLGNFQSFILGTAGNDTITGTSGADFIHGGAGDDEISALAGDDVAIGGLGNDNVSGDADDDLVVGGSGNDNLFGNSGNDVVSGDKGNDVLHGGSGNDILSGGEGDDIVVTGSGDDRVLFGRGDGHDIVEDSRGESLQEIYTAGGGFASGYSWNGAGGTKAVYDPVNYRIADGFFVQYTGNLDWSIYAIEQGNTDTLSDIGEDTLEFKLGVSLQDIRVMRQGNDLVLAISATNDPYQAFDDIADSVRFTDWFVAGYTAPIETLSIFGFGDIDATSITGWVGGDIEDDNLVGTSGRDWITGGAGQDNIKAYGGDDIINAGAGNDLVAGGAGADVMLGGQGEDTLDYSAAGSGVAVSLTDGVGTVGDAAGDQFDSFEHIIGSDFDDVLIGDDNDNEIHARGGDDRVVGGAGNDLYIFHRGDGILRVAENDSGLGITGGGEDTLQFGADINPGDLDFLRVGQDLQITLHGTTDQIVLENWFYDFSDRIETLLFADGGAIDIQYQLFEQNPTEFVDWVGGDDSGNTLNGLAGNDILSGRGGDDQINGGEGDDTLIGGLGSDSFDGGVGSDTVVYYDSDSGVTVHLDNSQAAAGGTAAGDSYVNVENIIGSSFNDELHGDDGNNVINAGKGDDQIEGGSGADTLHGAEGDDQIVGGDGQDTITGNAGADRIYGGKGDDIIRGGDESDTIYGNSGNDEIEGGDGLNTIYGGADNDLLRGGLDQDTLFGEEGHDELRGNAGDDILDGGAGDDELYGEQGSDRLLGGGGEDYISGGAGADTILGGSEDDVIEGGDGNDHIEGGTGHDILSGGAGDDHLIGGSGTDFLIGGEGNDRLEGGEGTDFYIFGGAFGQDTIAEAADRDTLDEVVFSGIGMERLWFKESGRDLIISVIGTQDQVRIENFARFRINADTTGEVLDLLQQALVDMSSIDALRVDTHSLSLDALNQLIDSMAGIAEPDSVGEIPQEVAQAQTSLWQQTELTALDARIDYAPVLSSETFESDEDVQVDGVLQATDRNPEELFNYEIHSQPKNGVLLLDGATGAFTFTPEANFSGVTSAVVSVTDSTGRFDFATLRFQITPVDDAATVASSISLVTTEDSGVTGNLAFSDVDDVFGNYQVTADAALGNVEFLEDGRFIYRPFQDAAGQDDFTISLTDTSGRVYNTSVSVEILGANDRPEAQINPLVINAAEDTTVNGQIVVTDADGDTLTYTLVGGSLGQLTLNADGSFSYQLAQNFTGQDSFVVRATDSSGDLLSYADTQVIINVSNVNDAPASLDITGDLAIDENAGPNQIVGVAVASDPEGQAITYSLLDSANVPFSINATTGVISTKQSFDFETANSHDITVVATDSDGASLQQTATISVANVNEQPYTLSFSGAFTVDENLPAGTVVGTVSATDPDVGDTLTYTLLEGQDAFEIVGNQIRTIRALDVDVDGVNMNLRVRVTDSGGLTRDGSQTVIINEVDIGPSGIEVTQTLSVNENATAGTLVGQVAATGGEPGEQFDYEITAGSGFTIDDNGYIYVAVGADIDYEQSATRNVTVEVQDLNGNPPVSKAFSIQVVDLDEAPTAISWSGNTPTISENTSQGSVVGSVVVTDPDQNAAFRDWVFSMDNNNAQGRFTINSDTGVISVGAAALDVSSDASYTVSVRATDRDDPASYIDVPLNINVLNENSAPVAIANIPGVAINEFSAWRPADGGPSNGAANGQVVLTQSQLNSLFSDSDGDSLTFSITSGNTGGAFGISNNRLVISNASTINYENLTSYTLNIKANDGEFTSTNAASVTVNIQDIYESQLIQGGYAWFDSVVYTHPDYYLDLILQSNNKYYIQDVIEQSTDVLIASYNYLGFGLYQVDVYQNGYFYDYSLVGDGSWQGNEDRALYKDWEYFLTPVVLDLDNNGLTFSNGLMFDLDNDGTPEETPWVGSGDAFLALDRNSDGIINNGSEISFLGDLAGASTDLEGLTAFDTNDNGLLDAGDERFGEFLVWQDVNQNGISEAGEPLTLSEAGISSIDLQRQPNPTPTGVSGVELLNTSTFTRTDGSTSQVGDVRLAFSEVGEESGANAPLQAGTAGSDTIIGSFAADNIDGLAGEDILFGGVGNDLIQGGDGDDLVSGDEGNDRLFGGAGVDEMRGGEGDDWLDGGADNDTIDAGRGNDTVYAGSGEDVVYAGLDDDVVYGEAGIDRLYGEDGNDWLSGGDDGDLLSGGAGQDVLLGGGGADTLIGEAGDDVLAGELGDDEIDGGSGANQLWFGRGDGADRVTGTAGTYTLYLVGIAPNEIQFREEEEEEVLVLDFGAGDQISFAGYDPNGLFNAVESGSLSLISINFASGESWDRTELLKQLDAQVNVVIEGTFGNDLLTGTDGEEIIEALDGDDQVDALGGDDQVFGLTGADQISGGTGDDYLDGGEGDDVIAGDDGNDELYGASGSDQLSGGAGFDRLYGGDDGDTLDGGADDDELYGEAGDDTLVGAEGNDSLIGGDGVDDLSGGIGDDTLLGGAGNDLLAGGAGSDFLTGGEGEDMLLGEDDDDIINGDADNDTLYGGLGNDLLAGDAGNDILYGEEDNDSLSGGIGDDLLDGGLGNDVIVGEAGNDDLSGGDGNDVLIGGEGLDQLAGGLGDDSYYIGADGELDQLTESQAASPLAGGTDRIEFETGISSADVTARLEEGNVIFAISGVDELVVNDWYGGGGVEFVEFEDEPAVSWTRAQVEAMLPPVAEEDFYAIQIDEALVIGLDELLANDVDANGDPLSITAVSNVVNGSAVLDVAGETITFTPDAGYNGSASFEYLVTDGTNSSLGLVNIAISSTLAISDRVVTPEGVAIAIDVLANDQYSSAGGVTVSNDTQPANGTAVVNPDGTITYTPNAGFKGTDSFIYEIYEGSSVSAATVYVSVAEKWFGTTGSDTVTFDGTAHPIIFDGKAGGDTLTGGSGDDTFIHRGAVDGFDTLEGGDGFDRIVATAGDDAIGIKSLSGIEQIDGGAGSNTIKMTYWGNYLDLSNTELLNIEGIQGANNHDTIIGSAGDDYIVGGLGDDTLRGGAGDDLFGVNGTTDGSDHFDGGAGYDTIVGGAGDDIIVARSLTDIEAIDGGAGYNVLKIRYSSSNILDVSNIALTNIDELNGSGSHVTIIGTAGDDYIVGGGGDDTLRGGDGDDLFGVNGTSDGSDHFDGGAGYDTIVGGTGDDVIGVRSLTDIEAIDGGAGYNVLKIRYSSSNILDVSNIALTNIDELNGSGSTATIIGTAGDDYIVGGLYNDNLTGGSGNDTYGYSAGDGADVIKNYSGTAATDTDTLVLDNILNDQLWFSQNGNDLVIDRIGSGDRITVDDWYLGADYELDEIRAGTNNVLMASQVDQLVQAMAAISATEPANLGDLTAQQQDDLNTAIAAAWQ